MPLPTIQFRTGSDPADLILPAALLAAGLELSSPPHILQSCKLDSRSHATPTGISWSFTGLTSDRQPLLADRARTTWRSSMPTATAGHPLQYAALLADNYRLLAEAAHRDTPRLWIIHHPSHSRLSDRPPPDAAPLPEPSPDPPLAWHWINALIAITLGHTISAWGRHLGTLRLAIAPAHTSPYPLAAIIAAISDPSRATQHHSPLEQLVATLANHRIICRELNSLHRLTALTTRRGGPAAMISDHLSPAALDRVSRHLNI